MSIEEFNSNVELIKYHAKKGMINKFDWWHLNVGEEGAGKSYFAIRLCKKIDPNFSVDNIVFSYDEFMIAVEKFPPMSAILIDEGGEVFHLHDTMSREQKRATKDAMEMRSKQLFVCINFTYFPAISKYLKFHRIKKYGLP